MDTNQSNDPWHNESINNNDGNVENVKIIENFDDDFNSKSIDCSTTNNELNENGLSLPDSKKYLNNLENRLKKLNCNDNRNRQAKKMLKELASKRDGLFDCRDNVDIQPDIISIPDETDEKTTNPITETIVNSNIYEKMERKLCPHLQTIDPEESKKLLKHDVLDFITNNNDQREINEKKSD